MEVNGKLMDTHLMIGQDILVDGIDWWNRNKKLFSWQKTPTFYSFKKKHVRNSKRTPIHHRASKSIKVELVIRGHSKTTLTRQGRLVVLQMATFLIKSNISAPIERHSWLDCHLEQNPTFLLSKTRF